MYRGDWIAIRSINYANVQLEMNNRNNQFAQGSPLIIFAFIYYLCILIYRCFLQQVEEECHKCQRASIHWTCASATDINHQITVMCVWGKSSALQQPLPHTHTPPETPGPVFRHLYLHLCEMAHYQQTNQLALLSEHPLVIIRASKDSPQAGTMLVPSSWRQGRLSRRWKWVREAQTWALAARKNTRNA